MIPLPKRPDNQLFVALRLEASPYMLAPRPELQAAEDAKRA